MLSIAVLGTHVADASAQTNTAAPGEASGHFRRGVELYGEANYGGALVEFKRANELAPSAAALYDVGQTQFQLQDYAGALRTFREFAKVYSGDASHYADVEAGIEVLRTRVGVIRVTTVPSGADVSVDDVAVGRTPLDGAVLVSVGRRKVVASMRGRSSVVRYVDVAAEDNVPVTLGLIADGAAPPLLADGSSADPAAAQRRSAISSKIVRNIGWGVTGALGAGAAVFGGLAITASHSLQDARAAYPTSPGTLQHDANITTTYAVVADSLGVATAVAAVFSLYFTWKAARETSPEHAAQVKVGPRSVSFEATF